MCTVYSHSKCSVAEFSERLDCVYLNMSVRLSDCLPWISHSIESGGQGSLLVVVVERQRWVVFVSGCC